jgi:curved DNA-binding protein CbpA
MGNGQSNPHEYTPEQYKQYLEYQEQQKCIAQQPPFMQSTNVQFANSNVPIQSQQVSVKPNIEKPVAYNKPTQYNNQVQTNYMPNTKNNINVEYNNQQQSRTQIKREINLDNKMIPDLQQKKYMPSVENHYQDAYQQRMIDNMSIGSKNMVSGATYTGKPNLYSGQNPHNLNSMGQFPDKTNTPTFMPNILEMGSNEYEVSNGFSVSNIQNNDREAQFMKREKAREMEFIKAQEKRIEEEHRRFKEEQNRRRAQFNEELSEVENLKYDPAQILGLDKNLKYDINDIKKAYRNLALKYHPDKGGSEEIFKILTKAYIALSKKNEKDNYKEKSFYDLKSQYKNNNEHETQFQEDEFDVKHFNSIFDEYKLENLEIDNGYGEWMKDDTKDPPKSSKIFNQKFNLDIFNKVFDELKTDDETNKVNEQITIYKEPEILPVGAGLQYSDVDYNKIGDYSREFNVNDNTKGLFFTDYKKAHTNTTLINPNSVNKREQYKNVEELTQVREKQNFTLTDEERKQLELKSKLEEEKENQRLLRLKQRDEALALHSSKVNKLLLGKDVSVPTRQLDYTNK